MRDRVQVRVQGFFVFQDQVRVRQKRASLGSLSSQPWCNPMEIRVKRDVLVLSGVHKLSLIQGGIHAKIEGDKKKSFIMWFHAFTRSVGALVCITKNLERLQPPWTPRCISDVILHYP